MKSVQIILFILICLRAGAEEISVVVPANSLGNTNSPRLTITADQTIELLSVMSYGSDNVWPVILDVDKEGAEVRVRPIMGSALGAREPGPYTKPEMTQFILRGPATIKAGSTVGNNSLLTFRITPNKVDPTKTAIVYPGIHNTAKVNLISSTNLTDWIVATNGIYSGDVAQFFRIDIQTTTQP